MSIVAGQQILASDFISTSAGAGDSGKVPKLNASGKLDSSFLEGSTVSLTAEEDITAGQPVGSCNNLVSKVARAMRFDSLTVALGYTVDSAIGTKDSMVVPIGGDKFVIIGSQTSDDTLYATIGTVNRATLTITLGTPVAVTADSSNSADKMAVCKLDTDKFIVFYTEDASTTLLKSRIATVSGTVPSFGTAVTFATGATAVETIHCDQISTNKGVMFYRSTTPANSRIIAFTASGTVATVGTPIAIGTTIDDNINSSAIKTVATDKFIFATTTGGATSNLCQVGTLSGTTITLGSEVASNTTDNLQQKVFIVSPASNVAVISAQDGSQIASINACTISGTVPTFGTAVAGQQYDCSLWVESATVILQIAGSSSGTPSITKYTLSGNALTSVGRIVNRSGTDCMIFCPMDNGYYISVGEPSATTLNYYIQGMSNTFVGIAQETKSRGQAVKVLYSGVDANQTNLIAGATYQITSAGLTLVSSNNTMNTVDDKYVVAVSTTQVIVGTL